MLNIKNCHGDIQPSIRTRNFSLVDIANEMRFKLSVREIPATVNINEIKSGGLFGKTYNCLFICHPNPPQQYYDHVYIVDNDTITFKYYGSSKAMYNSNRKEQLRNAGTISGMIKSAFINDDEMAFQQEANWHDDVIRAFNDLFVNNITDE